MIVALGFVLRAIAGGSATGTPISQWFLVVTAVVLAIFLGSLTWSIGSVLSAPGTNTVAARMAEWSRDHGLGFAVTAAENIQYWLNPPKIGGNRPEASSKISVPKQPNRRLQYTSLYNRLLHQNSTMRATLKPL